MPVTLISYPVISSSGKVRNIFAGFNAIELFFKREDAQIVSVSQGADNKILIDIAGNITGSLNVGEWIYLYSEGTNYTYNNSYQIINITFNSPNTEITVNADFIEITSSGYCNYKQNWFLESKLVNPDNNIVLKYPSLLQTDGNPNGDIQVNVSMLVDFLKNEIKETSQEITSAREECKVMYRESWREDDTSAFTLIDLEPIVVIFSAENEEIENFLNGFETPRIWEGYPFWLNLLHSVQNESGKSIRVTFDELNINGSNINEGNKLVDFNPNDFGILQANFQDKVKVIEEETRFITFNANSIASADYQTGDYNDNDYLTINTP